MASNPPSHFVSGLHHHHLGEEEVAHHVKQEQAVHLHVKAPQLLSKVSGRLQLLESFRPDQLQLWVLQPHLEDPVPQLEEQLL